LSRDISISAIKVSFAFKFHWGKNRIRNLPTKPALKKGLPNKHSP
jgi:hypothetical protein